MVRKSAHNFMAYVVISGKEDYSEFHKSFDLPPRFPCAMLGSARNMTSFAGRLSFLNNIEWCREREGYAIKAKV